MGVKKIKKLYNNIIMNILEVKNLNVSFEVDDEIYPVVENLNFALEKGKTLGIVGESGCGKSVSLMSILKLLPKNAIVNADFINFEGQNIANLNENEMQKIRGNKIALIPQDPMSSLNPLYTIGDQIMEVIRFHQKVSKTEAKELAIEALRQVNINDAEKRLNDYPHQFSGGMSQRAIIAMALSCKPKLIIADEPTTALDVTVQAQIMNLFKEIQQKFDTTIIFVTHDLALISQIADEIMVMYNGHVVEKANCKEFFNNPLHPYSQGLLGALPSSEKGILKTIRGQPPTIKENVTGCKFHPRCDFASSKCNDRRPDYTERKLGHYVRCWLR